MDRQLYVANGKGGSSFANAQGPNPLLPRNASTRQYIAGLMHGTLSILDVPTPERMGEYTKQAYSYSPLRAGEPVVGEVPPGSPVPAKVGDSSPIKYA